MTASVLKQDPNTEKVKKNVLYQDQTTPANFQGNPLCQVTKWHFKQQLKNDEKWSEKVSHLSMFGWANIVFLFSAWKNVGISANHILNYSSTQKLVSHSRIELELYISCVSWPQQKKFYLLHLHLPLVWLFFLFLWQLKQGSCLVSFEKAASAISMAVFLFLWQLKQGSCLVSFEKAASAIYTGFVLKIQILK